MVVPHKIWVGAKLSTIHRLSRVLEATSTLNARLSRLFVVAVLYYTDFLSFSVT